MAYTMKDSPHKRGAIEGTESALKLGGFVKLAKFIYKAVTPAKKAPWIFDKTTGQSWTSYKKYKQDMGKRAKTLEELKKLHGVN